MTDKEIVENQDQDVELHEDENEIMEAQAIEKMETEIKKAPRADLYEVQVREFKNFLSLLKS